MCLIGNKCNWCGKREKNIYKINIWCKWYGYHICEDCYDNKLINKIKYPKYK